MVTYFYFVLIDLINDNKNVYYHNNYACLGVCVLIFMRIVSMRWFFMCIVSMLCNGFLCILLVCDSFLCRLLVCGGFLSIVNIKSVMWWFFMQIVAFKTYC